MGRGLLPSVSSPANPLAGITELSRFGSHRLAKTVFEEVHVCLDMHVCARLPLHKQLLSSKFRNGGREKHTDPSLSAELPGSLSSSWPQDDFSPVLGKPHLGKPFHSSKSPSPSFNTVMFSISIRRAGAWMLPSPWLDGPIKV